MQVLQVNWKPKGLIEEPLLTVWLVAPNGALRRCRIGLTSSGPLLRASYMLNQHGRPEGISLITVAPRAQAAGWLLLKPLFDDEKWSAGYDRFVQWKDDCRAAKRPCSRVPDEFLPKRVRAMRVDANFGKRDVVEALPHPDDAAPVPKAPKASSDKK